MAELTDITRKNSKVKTPELNWLFEEWARTIYGDSLVRTFNRVQETKPANLYCPSCNALYSAHEAFNAKLEYATVFTARGLKPAERGLAERLGKKVREYLAENSEKLEEGGWAFDPDSVRIGQPEENTAPFLAWFDRRSERKFLYGDLDQEGNVIHIETETSGGRIRPRLVRRADGEARVYTLKVAGEEKADGGEQADLRCHQPDCRDMPLETFRMGTDQTFDPNDGSEKWSGYDKYMLALPEPPLGPDSGIDWDATQEYVSADYLNALLLEDGANGVMLYLEKINRVQRLEIPGSGLPRGWRVTADAAQAYRRKAQHFHETGIRTPYLQFLRWREKGAEGMKWMLNDIGTRVRDDVKGRRTDVEKGTHEASRIASAKRIADFRPLASKPDTFDKYAGENLPQSYVTEQTLEVHVPDRNLMLEIALKHAPELRLTRNSSTHDRLKRIVWEFLWPRGGESAD